MKQYTCFLIAALFLLVSCSNDDTASNSSAEKAIAAINECKSLLCRPANGWVMTYYPKSNVEYGGYTMLMRFSSDGTVDMSNELLSPDEIHSSLYSVKQSAGIFLSFSTYNEVIHLFSDPSAPFRGNTGEGMSGDYDFSVMSMSPDSIVLKGRKSGTRAVMTPLKTDVKWSDYLSEVNANEFEMTFKKYTLSVNGKTYDVQRKERNLNIFEEGNLKAVAAYCLTPDGIQLYEPLVLEGKKMCKFSVTDYDAYPETADETIVLTPVIPGLNEYLVEGMWFISYSNLGTYGQKYWNYLKKSLDTINEELLYAFIGTFNGRFGFTFNSSGYVGSLYYEYQHIGKDQISLHFPLMADTNGANYYNQLAGMKSALVPFAHTSTRFFIITADDAKRPTWLRLTDKYEKSNSILLTRDIITYPFEH